MIGAIQNLGVRTTWRATDVVGNMVATQARLAGAIYDNLVTATSGCSRRGWCRGARPATNYAVDVLAALCVATQTFTSAFASYGIWITVRYRYAYHAVRVGGAAALVAGITDAGVCCGIERGVRVTTGSSIAGADYTVGIW